jgi:hypothetical protein
MPDRGTASNRADARHGPNPWGLQVGLQRSDFAPVTDVIGRTARTGGCPLQPKSWMIQVCGPFPIPTMHYAQSSD